MNAPGAIDAINRKTMRSAVAEYSAIVHEALSSAETEAIGSVLPQIKGKSILDLGIGAGRTIRPLLQISASYVGVDYTPEMIDHCRQAFPGVDLQVGDARSMPQFADETFDLIVFSCNGICMVDHAGRLAILREVYRLLRKDGVFIFSTCNRDSPQYRARFRFPEFQFSRNLARLVVRSARFLVQTAQRVRNRLRLLSEEVRNSEFAIINDVCHHYNTMLYFITIDEQRKQLIRTGFAKSVRAYGLSGELIGDNNTDGTVTFVAHKH